MFPLDRLSEIQQRPQDFKLLERVPLTRDDVLTRLPIVLQAAEPNERLISVVFLDTETTGMSPVKEKIIELGLVRCTVSLDRKLILSVDRVYDAYEDPKVPIPEEITRLTGINDDMVRGKAFNQEEVLAFFADHPLTVAHNAKFDRPFFDRRFSSLGDLAWACSQNEIDWHMLGYGGYKLEFLVQSSGYFYDAHRACNDCLALCFLMVQMPEALEMLLTNSLQLVYKIEAVNSPFNVKDLLKEQGYRWDSAQKLWYIQVVSPEEAVAQLNYLQSIYPEALNHVKITSYSAQDRYRS